MEYLVVKCEPLGDQWECDANRIPICLTKDWSNYNKFGYEVYKLKNDGTFELIRDYETPGERNISVCIWNSLECEEKDPDIIINICKGDRSKVTKSMIKKIKQRYHFSETIDEIFFNISAMGSYGEEIEGKWIGFGERTDNYFYPLGF